MNLGDIELGLYDRLNFNATPDSAVTRRVRQSVNNIHREILGRRGFGQLRRKVLTATSVANSPFMVLPQAATAILIVADRLNNRNLKPATLQDIRYRDPGLLFTGSIPDSYAVIDYASCVAADPSTPSSLWVTSDSASDASGSAVNIEGITSTGYYQRASVALNGLTPVNIAPTVTTWVTMTKFYMTAVASGNVTLLQGSGVGPELSRIPPGRSYPRYTTLHLIGIPATSLTYYCDVELYIEDMTSVNDEPLLLEDYHWLLEAGVMSREYLKRGSMDQYTAEQRRFKEGIDNLGAALRRRGGVSIGGQRNNQNRQISQYNSPWMNG